MIVRYDLSILAKVGKPFGQSRNAVSGHDGEILCLAASEDGKWLVSGGRDKMVGIWNVENNEPKWVTGMKGHKDAVTVSLDLNEKP